MADSDKALPLSVLSTIRDWVRSLIPTKTSDLTNDSGFAQKNIWYGTCGTAAGTAAKVVTTSSGDFELATGSMVRVYFTNANTYNGTATLNVDGKGAKNISRVGSTTTTRYYWSAGEVVDFVYDGTRFVMSRSGTATTTYFGLTKLATSAVSTATGTALTPQSLNGLAQYMLSGVAPYSASATYAVGDRVRYGYYIYECNTAITTAEAWTAAHWTALDPLLDLIEAKPDAADIPTRISDLTNDSGFITDAGVTSFNGNTGAVTYTAPVTSVNGNTGAVTVVEGMTPLIGFSEDITPAQVKTALTQGRDICIVHNGELAGVDLELKFTAWNSAMDVPYQGAAVNVIVSQTIAYYNGTFYLFELVGSVSAGIWELLSTTLAKTSDIPTEVSDLINDVGYITGYTETDPTVPAWAKAASKPTYTASEVGAIPTTGGDVDGGLTLKSAAATNSPSLIFQRGTLTDNYNDWQIQDRGGFLYFDQRGQGSSAFANQVVFNTSGNVSATSFSGSGASLSNLNASNLSSGTVPSARLPVASTSAAGAVMVDGSTVTISNGVISATGGGTLPIDTALDDTSTNAVQNKVVKSAIDAKQDELTFDNTPISNSNNPVTSDGIATAITSATLTTLETPPIMFIINVSGNQAVINATLVQILFAYNSTNGCIFAQPLAPMTSMSDANVRIYEISAIDVTTATIKLVAVEGSTIHIVEVTDTGNNSMSGTYTSVTIPSAITVDDNIDEDSENPVKSNGIFTALQMLSSILIDNACLAQGTSTSQTSGTDVTQVTLNTKTVDTSGDYTISSGGVQVAETGYYRISGSVYITPASGTTTMGCYIKVGSAFSSATEVNGVLQYMGATGARAVQCIPKIVHLTSGQIVFLGSRCRGAAGTHNAAHAETFLQVEKMPLEMWE